MIAFRKMDRDELHRQLCEIDVQLVMAGILIRHGLPTDKDGFPLYADARLRKAMVRFEEASAVCTGLTLYVYGVPSAPVSLQHVHDTILALADDLSLPLDARLSDDPVMALRTTQAERAMEEVAARLEELADELGEPLNPDAGN
jgi:hypothetical protein